MAAMNPALAKTWDMVRLVRRGGPALCNIAVTNSCNAGCDFCNFARGKLHASHLRWIDAEQFDRALDILHQRDVRYVSFFGGEPLLHPRLADLIAMAIAKDMGPALITNGWLLPQKIDALAEAGLKSVYVSIDAVSMAAHETNRGLKGLGERIKSAITRTRELGVTPLAQVTMSKLIGDYRELVPLLREMGFAAVAFSYPQGMRLILFAGVVELFAGELHGAGTFQRFRFRRRYARRISGQQSARFLRGHEAPPAARAGTL